MEGVNSKTNLEKESKTDPANEERTHGPQGLKGLKDSEMAEQRQSIAFRVRLWQLQRLHLSRGRAEANDRPFLAPKRTDMQLSRPWLAPERKPASSHGCWPAAQF